MIGRDDTVYISCIIQKYSQNPLLQDEWVVPALDCKLSKNMISHAEYMRQYEMYIRQYHWVDLDSPNKQNTGF